MYVFGCRLSLFRLCGSDFGITSVDDITNGTSYYYYYYYYYYYSEEIVAKYRFCMREICLLYVRVSHRCHVCDR